MEPCCKCYYLFYMLILASVHNNGKQSYFVSLQIFN